MSRISSKISMMLTIFVLVTKPCLALESIEAQKTTSVKSTEIDPKDFSQTLSRGEELFKSQRYYAAVDVLTECVRERPDNEEAWLYLARAYQCQNKFEASVEAYEKYIALDPKNPERSKYEALLAILKQQSQDQKKVSNISPQTNSSSETGFSSSNYLQEVVLNGTYTWPKDKRHLHVYVYPGDSVSGYVPDFDESLRNAFDTWSTKSNNLFNFEFVKDPANAEMTVVWTDDLHAPALVAEAGLAQLDRGPDGIEKAEIKLLTLDPFKDGPLGKRHLRNVCLHEIGHGLGLNGHSQISEDIMYPQLELQDGISQRDLNTIIALYSADAPALIDKVKAKRRAPRNAQEEEQRLLDDGTQAAMTGDFKAAAELLAKALVIQPNNSLARKNYAVCLNNIANMQSDNESVVKYYRTALFWDDSCEVARASLNNYLIQDNQNPGSFDCRAKLGDQFFKKGDYKAAVVEYKEALKIKDNPIYSKKLDGALRLAMHPVDNSTNHK